MIKITPTTTPEEITATVRQHLEGGGVCRLGRWEVHECGERGALLLHVATDTPQTRAGGAPPNPSGWTYVGAYVDASFAAVALVDRWLRDW